MSNGVCAACSRSIDALAKLCPYCGADPATGERLDTQALLDEVFQPKTLSTSESVIEYARQRQGIVVAVSILVAFLALAGLHQYVTMRNASAVTDSPAVPLTEITDVAKLRGESAPVAMPPLDFPYEGRPQTMRTFILEKGAIAPPAPIGPEPNPSGTAAAAGATTKAPPARAPQVAPQTPPAPR